jgi:hypothetical protein
VTLTFSRKVGHFGAGGGDIRANIVVITCKIEGWPRPVAIVTSSVKCETGTEHGVHDKAQSR